MKIDLWYHLSSLHSPHWLHLLDNGKCHIKPSSKFTCRRHCRSHSFHWSLLKKAFCITYHWWEELRWILNPLIHLPSSRYETFYTCKITNQHLTSAQKDHIKGKKITIGVVWDDRSLRPCRSRLSQAGISRGGKSSSPGRSATSSPCISGHICRKKNCNMLKSSSDIPLQNTLWQLFCTVTFDAKFLVVHLASLLGFHYMPMCTTS